VIIELPPYRGPRSPLDLVVVEHTFGRLFEAFRLASQAARTGTSAGEDAQPSKRARAPPMKRMIMSKYIMILLLLILSLIISWPTRHLQVDTSDGGGRLPWDDPMKSVMHEG
jgi:hypothetical protein